eukprot:GHVP01008769.1.p1 GENE.GHVP01008769.1~~GHVP01008769.1.p1  ORF type:complete len:101 (-),score=12.45 GHVP01008769.1:124-426(-)
MPQGFCNSGAVFQDRMDRMFPRQQESPLVFVDDILIHASTFEELLVRTEGCLTSLSGNGLSINLEKSIFGARSLKYLGHIISSEGAKPVESKVEAIESYL